jgi:hypothetical protein
LNILLLQVAAAVVLKQAAVVARVVIGHLHRNH